MPSMPKSAAIIADFPGLQLTIDPRDIEDGGAEVQINACSLNQGELTVRRGVKEVVFEVPA